MAVSGWLEYQTLVKTNSGRYVAFSLFRQNRAKGFKMTLTANQIKRAREMCGF
jgi:hypothetical protein